MLIRIVTLAALVTAGVTAFVNMINPVVAAKSVTENSDQVQAWNRFTYRLLQVHRHFLQAKRIRRSVETGGYAGQPDFYKEESYFDADNGRLMSRIRWEREHPDKVHVIEVFFYDDAGRVIRDYSAAYLPKFRNAPYQTLINYHANSDDLHAFRQFDASGGRLFEHCSGNWFGKPVRINLDEPLIATPDALLNSEAYLACFGSLPAEAGKDLDPTARIPQIAAEDRAALENSGADEARIGVLSLKLRFSPRDARLFLERGKVYLTGQNFNKAIADFSRAIELDDSLDQAYFGRGMARGRIGELDAGISDLSVFIARNPNHSTAYTKRGVRHIWKRDMVAAEKDLRRAIALNPQNAEAHDDLGVVLARRKEYDAAISHFRTTVRLDASYQKGHHNLALVLHLLGSNEKALVAIDNALNLGPDTRSSVLLKSSVLGALGRKREARRFRQDAETLPTKNWSENLAVE